MNLQAVLLCTYALLTSRFSPAHAQVVADGATNTLNNFTNTFASVTVGTNGSFTLLVLSNNVSLTNSSNGTIGLNLTARSNQVRLISPTVRWQSGNSLSVGSNGSFNRLVVSNGASVFTANSSFIGQAPGANSNSAAVIGAGTRWQAGNLFVGDNAEFNSLVVSNGGLVECLFAEIGRNAGAANNHALITGTGSLLTMPGSVLVGDAGSGNRLTVSNGAATRTDVSFIGFSSAANTALITGAGSVWTNASLLVGRSGSNNRLVASNGATVFTTTHGFIGFNTNANLNAAIVTDPGTRWLVNSNLHVGSNGALSQLIVSNGAVLVNLQGVLGSSASSTGNTALITGAGTVWSNRGVLNLGGFGRGNRLVISNGAVLRSANCDFGEFTSGSDNEALIIGPGSTWTATGNLNVGLSSSGNRLVITNGGLVSCSASLMGAAPQSTNNEMLVTGPDSTWSALLNLTVGTGGSGNRLVITNGAAVSARDLIIGNGATSTNNRVTVDGGTLRATNLAGTAILDVRRGTNVFNAGLIDVSRLVLTNSLGRFEFNGGTLITRSAVITENSPFIVGTSGNAPAVWDVRAGPSNHFLSDIALYVGNSTPFNQLFVTNGAVLTSENEAVMGLGASSHSNTASISGSGSQWSSGPLSVGFSGSVNRLLVGNGGSVFTDGNGYIGYNEGANSNIVMVTGAGSLWTNLGEMYVGQSGSGNQLVISNGGTVSAQGTRFLGHFSEATSNNAVTVTGAGSRWLGPGNLEVGGPAVSCRLLVSDGGRVENNSGFIGSRSNNLAVVTGAGSVWSNGLDLRVGSSAAGNQLVVSNGGMVVSVLGNVGYAANSSNNAALVTGPGSVWSTSDLNVGAFGSSNRLVVSGGGRVDNDFGYIGASGHSNEALVTGTGSHWSNRFDLAVGFFGDANRLVVSNSGTVFGNAGIVVGFDSSSTSNRIIVDGGTLRAINPTNGLLDIRRGTNVLNSGLIDVSRLVLTNTLGRFELNGGTLITRGAAISNGQAFFVGRSGVPGVWHVGTGAGNHALAGPLSIGLNASSCQLFVTNGAVLTSSEGVIGFGTNAHFNSAIVAGPGAVWNMGEEDIDIGASGSGNVLVVSNGGWVISGFADIGELIGDTNNRVRIVGNNSGWQVRSGLRLGREGAGSRIDIEAGGTLTVSNRLFVGAFPATSTNNLLHVLNGSLLVTNGETAGLLDIISGTNRLDAGLVEVDRFVITNGRGEFVLNGGALRTAGTTIGNGRVFTIGNGTSAATFQLQGGSHNFSNGLAIANNSVLTGRGTVTGTLSLQTGGKLSPGTSPGKIVLSNSPSLQGAVVMEISKSGATLTNDQIQVTAPLTYGGSLIVSNLGPTTLAAGDRFPLFSATSFAGMFPTLSLPKPGPGLNWTNKLLLDGSIEVVTWAGPRFGNVTRSGTNLILSVTDGFPGGAFDVLTTTNIVTPLTNWITASSATFDAFGNVTLTNGIAFTEPQRYFRIRTP